MNKFWHDIKIIVVVFFLMVASVAITLWIVREVNVFSPPQSRVSAGSTSVGPAQLMRVTAYCPKKCCCGKFADGYTASGKPAVGLIVAAPPNLAFGTVLYIPGYGNAFVEDRGGAITGNRLDVLFATHEEAKQWGVQYLKVRIVIYKTRN